MHRDCVERGVHRYVWLRWPRDERLSEGSALTLVAGTQTVSVPGVSGGLHREVLADADLRGFWDGTGDWDPGVWSEATGGGGFSMPSSSYRCPEWYA
jgi:hypothetical protein